MNVPASPSHPARRKPRRYVDPYAREVASIFGPALTDKQVANRTRQQAQAQVRPLLGEIEREIKRRSAAEQQHLAAATRSYAQLAGQYAPQAAQIYGGAAQSQAAVDAALSQSLAGGGQQLANELQGKLAGIAAPGAVGSIPGAAAQTGLGAGNAALASGSAELSRLLAHGTAAQDYGAKLPVFAGATGLQRSSEIAGRYADELGQRTGEVNAKLPSLIAGLLSDNRTAQAQRARDVAAYENAQRNRSLQREIAQNANLLDVEQAVEAQRHHRQTEKASARSTGESARHHKQTEAATSRSTSERERHNRRSEAQRRRSESERERHNRKTEKKKSTSTAPPWASK